MDIEYIEDSIYELEGMDLTTDTAIELASLYIIKDHLLKGVSEASNDDKSDDILPAYRKYCNIKRQYQLNELPETAIIAAIGPVCQEITEIVDTLYSGTDIGKERRQILKMLDTLYRKYNS